MQVCPKANCTSWPDVAANPDIAGAGVIAGFMISAYATLIFVIIHYFFDFRNTVNPIDRAVIDAGSRVSTFIKRLWNGKASRPEGRLSKALEVSVLMFSDQQVVTGIAILAGGFSQLQCGISTYHWQIIVNLAWFSSVTHLTTLTMLRRYFRDRPALAKVRVVLMGITLIMLGVAIGPTGYVPERYNGPNAVPAICLYSSKAWQEFPHGSTEHHPGLLQQFNSTFIIISLVYLATSYVSRVVKLFGRSSRYAKEQLRDKPSMVLRRIYSAVNKKSTNSTSNLLGLPLKTLRNLILVSYVVLKACYTIEESILWEITWLVTALVWGSIRLITIRTSSDLPEEAGWGFGQILPLLLFALPTVSIFGTVYDLNRSVLTPGNGSSPVLPVTVVTPQASGMPEDHDFDKLKLLERVWFHMLLKLLFGIILAIAADILFNFATVRVNDYAWGTDNLDNNFQSLFRQYFLWFSFNCFIVFFYVSFSLMFHFRTNSSLPLPISLSIRYANLSKKTQDSLQAIVWVFLLVVLVVGSALFDYFMFNSSNPIAAAWVSPEEFA